MIRDAIDVDPETGVMAQWKKFMFADAITFVAESVDAIKPETINSCWRNLWPDCILEFTGFPTIDTEVRNILTNAREVGGKGW